VTKRKNGEVDKYIARCPKEAQGNLGKVRAAIRMAAPGATERTDYFQMPGYSYPGVDYYHRMFAWFSFKKPYVRLHVPPSVIQEHRNELAGYVTTKAIVSFPKGKSDEEQGHQPHQDVTASDFRLFLATGAFNSCAKQN
jgi:uncharacterized protein YdhG (YjbR/CyaY superfamily)